MYNHSRTVMATSYCWLNESFTQQWRRMTLAFSHSKWLKAKVVLSLSNTKNVFRGDVNFNNVCAAVANRMISAFSAFKWVNAEVILCLCHQLCVLCLQKQWWRCVWPRLCMLYTCRHCVVSLTSQHIQYADFPFLFQYGFIPGTGCYIRMQA